MSPSSPDESSAPAVGSAVCRRCGTAFAPAPALVARYPGWTPSTCPRCYETGRRSGSGSTARVRGRTGTGTKARPRRGSGGAGEGRLTTAEVLERYDAGPDSGVFTDGSSIPNPGPGGWGAVYVVDGEVVAQAHGHDPDTTNNRMELRALLAALDLVPRGTPARIHTDSNLAVRTINEWAAGWQRLGWRRKSGPVENLDLVRPLFDGFHARPELELVWIKAHAGNRWNEYADALATAWMRGEV